MTVCRGHGVSENCALAIGESGIDAFDHVLPNSEQARQTVLRKRISCRPCQAMGQGAIHFPCVRSGTADHLCAVGLGFGCGDRLEIQVRSCYRSSTMKTSVRYCLPFGSVPR